MKEQEQFVMALAIFFHIEFWCEVTTKQIPSRKSSQKDKIRQWETTYNSEV